MLADSHTSVLKLAEDFRSSLLSLQGETESLRKLKSELANDNTHTGNATCNNTQTSNLTLSVGKTHTTRKSNYTSRTELCCPNGGVGCHFYGHLCLLQIVFVSVWQLLDPKTAAKSWRQEPPQMEFTLCFPFTTPTASWFTATWTQTEEAGRYASRLTQRGCEEQTLRQKKTQWCPSIILSLYFCIGNTNKWLSSSCEFVYRIHF